MQLNQAISIRLMELLLEKKMTQNELSNQSSLSRSTVSNIINCTDPSIELQIIHELCIGLKIDVSVFFNSSLFYETNLDTR